MKTRDLATFFIGYCIGGLVAVFFVVLILFLYKRSDCPSPDDVQQLANALPLLYIAKESEAVSDIQKEAFMEELRNASFSAIAQMADAIQQFSDAVAVAPFARELQISQEHVQQAARNALERLKRLEERNA